MSDKRKRRKPTYQYHPRAVDVTVYSADGSPVPQTVLDKIESLVTNVAVDNKLLVSVIKE